MCVCNIVGMNVCPSVCLYVGSSACLQCMHVGIYVCVHVCTCLCVGVDVHVCRCAYTYVYRERCLLIAENMREFHDSMVQKYGIFFSEMWRGLFQQISKKMF